MSDISIRILSKPERVDFLERNNLSKKQLSKIHDWMFKPAGVALTDYHPDKTCLRLREFEDKSATFVEIETIKTVVGYQDTKKVLGEGNLDELKNIAKELNYEEWGEMQVNSVEYKIKLDGDELTVLRQTINPVGDFLKIETESKKSLEKLLEIFEVEEKEKIERNAAVLIGETLELI